MAKFIAWRTAQGVLVVAAVAVIVFFVAHAAPGDPFSAALANPNVSESVRQQWIESYGLDRPLHEQLAAYVSSMAGGDLGWSFSLQRPVGAALREAAPYTLLLMLVALIASFAIGIGVALAQVKMRARKTGAALESISLFFYSVPDFWLAMLMLLLLAYRFPVFPIGGAFDPVVHESLGAGGKLLDRAKHLVLPALTLTLIASAVVARYQRASLLDVMPENYIRTARAKGLREDHVIRRHALRNALLPVVTLMGLSVPALVTGSVFIEKVFSWPGMGLLIVNAIGTRDYPLLLAAVVLSSSLVVAGSLVADVAYRILDPVQRDEH